MVENHTAKGVQLEHISREYGICGIPGGEEGLGRQGRLGSLDVFRSLCYTRSATRNIRNILCLTYVGA